MPSACDENALREYGLGLLSENKAAILRQHIAGCSSCSAYLSWFGTSSQSDPGGTENTAVEQLLALGETSWPTFVAAHFDRLANPRAVQSLIQACEDVLDRNAPRAELLSGVLTESADALPRGYGARTLQALAWTRRATALQRLGRLPEALSAVAMAERRAADIPAADYERALIGFTAADIKRELGRTDEALTEIRAAAKVFARYGDTQRCTSAREMEAAVLFRCGEYAAAVSIFLGLRDELSEHDPLARGRLAANAAHCLAKTGEHDRAVPLFAEAEAMFSELGYHSYVTRIAWGRARSLFASGDDHAAIAELRRVFAQFEEHRAMAEWVRVGIELVEWLLPHDDYQEIGAICNGVYERAIEAGMQLQALEALSYLREAALRRSLTGDRAQYVRHYIETLPASSTAQFLPPQ
jgi:tetratricopeptide (TPR) repeat protein